MVGVVKQKAKNANELEHLDTVKFGLKAVTPAPAVPQQSEPEEDDEEEEDFEGEGRGVGGGSKQLKVNAVVGATRGTTDSTDILEAVVEVWDEV